MGKKLNKEDFIKKAKSVHGDKYNYLEVVYVNAKTRVNIICSKHGMFLQTPNSHLNGAGCPECGSTKKLNTEDFINKAKMVHGNKYDYSEVEYVNNRTKVNIICPKHGIFSQIPNSHLNGNGCKKCGIENMVDKQSSNTEEFIERAKNVHKDKYDYSEVEYVNAKTKVNIICSKHGIFLQRPNDHLRGIGCKKCGIENIVDKQSSNIDDFINKTKNIHGDKYDYTEVEYVNSNTKVKIICPKHSMFLQTPNSHLRGRGCPECGGKKKKWNKESCYKEAKKYEWIGDYQKNSSGAYGVSLKNGWLKDYDWLKKKIKEGDNLGHVIYRYLIVDKYVYIGLSKNIDKRKRDRKSKWGRNDAVYKKCKELGVPIPEPTIIERCKNGIEAGEREIYWIKYYREVDTRYEVLNKNRGGSLGGIGCTSRRQSKEQFINKAKKVHGNKYNYSVVKYVNNKIKVNIICLKHGMFLQRPDSHLNGQGCPKCGGKKKLNTEDFIEKAKKIYRDKYDYSEVEYVNANTKVNIICPKHGMFLQRPANHLMGVECPKCGKDSRVKKNTKWNKESCYKEAKKYEWVGDLLKNSSRAYQVSCKNGWLKDYDWLKRKK